ncbi:cysteine hydrolase family protein [Sorangium sp. So ce124]|uniref:cysteine hydrolase family protein n=1 Tax=Sorangium sp. So ce124 TaxID=3133280 RepID=UPI003F6045D5
MKPRSALVIIDVQNGVLAGEAPVQGASGLLSSIAALLSRARDRGVPVIFVQDDEVGEVGSAAWDIHREVAPAGGEARVRKLACDAFFETDLAERLEQLGVEHLIIAGCKTEFCVDTTCRRAVTLGFDVTLAADAHGTSESPALAAAAIVAHHNRLLDGFGVMVAGRPREIRAVPSQQIEL